MIQCFSSPNLFHLLFNFQPVAEKFSDISLLEIKSAASEGLPIVLLTAVLLVACCVILHYEVLRALSVLALKFVRLARLRVLFIILGLLAAHILEIWIFAFGFYILSRVDNVGKIVGAQIHSVLDYVYFSAVTYTTLGYGDLLPVGTLRFLTAIEAVLGLLIMAWSASFTFLEMQRYWNDRAGLQ